MCCSNSVSTSFDAVTTPTGSVPVKVDSPVRRLGGVGASTKDLSLSVELSNFSEVDDTHCSTLTLSDLSEFVSSDFRQQLTDDCCSTSPSSVIDYNTSATVAPSCSRDMFHSQLPTRPETIGAEVNEPNPSPLLHSISADNSPVVVEKRSRSRRSRSRRTMRLTQYGYVDSDQHLQQQSKDISSAVSIADKYMLDIASHKPVRLVTRVHRNRRLKPSRCHSTS